jgi:hypothetical protein
MMDFISYYFLFALSVGIWACVEFLPEVRKTLFEANRIDDVMYDRPFIAFFTLLVISALMAPLVVLAILVPRWRTSAISALTKKV